MVGRLVEDQDVRLFQPRRRRDQHQPLPAARQRAERPLERLLARRRSRPAARRSANSRRPARPCSSERCSTSRTGRSARPAGTSCGTLPSLQAARADRPCRRSARARRSGISAASTCRRRSRRPARCGRRRAGTRRPRRRGPSRRRRRPAPCRARPDATPLSIPKFRETSTPSLAIMRPALITSLRLGRAATASASEPASTTTKSAGPPDLEAIVHDAEHARGGRRHHVEGQRQLLVVAEIGAVADHHGALQHVAVAERRPGIADIVGAAEHLDAVRRAGA